MTKLLSDATPDDFRSLRDKLSEELKSMKILEQASQLWVNSIYESFSNSIVLSRIFVTVPYIKLPAQNKTFVDQLSKDKGINHLLRDQTPVLTLLGTKGVKPAWNDRKQSKGHIGIPLVSGDFIDSIPMVSRMLKELGMDFDWIDKGDSNIITKLSGSMSGVFYVKDASSEVDQKSRKIIAAQDFVASHSIRTVFGFGGGYAGSDMFYLNIFFLRETIDKNTAENFASFMGYFKALTIAYAERNIFSS